jgi:dTDP-4-dehydrorhamnose reductase
MRILITGGSSLLAINWAKEILPSHNVALVEHLTPISLSGVEKYKISEISELKIQKIIQEYKPDIVINTIALTSVEKCELDLISARYVNVEIAKIIAQACHRNGTKMVHISTDHLYDGVGSMFSEDSPISPINNYATTKAEAEDVVLKECNSALIIRTNFYGPGLSYRDSFASKITNDLADNFPVALFEDVFYTPILIKVLVTCVNQLVAAGANGIFNVSSSERISKYEFGILLANAFTFDQDLVTPISLKDRIDLVRRPTDMSLSNEKLCKYLKMSMPSMVEQIKIFKGQYLK